MIKLQSRKFQKEAACYKTIKAMCKEIKQFHYHIQITPLDCTYCGAFVQACPITALKMVKRNHKLYKQETKNLDQCIAAQNRCYLVNKNTLLEFNGPRQECGESAIIKFLTQLYGEQLYLANATVCSLVWSATFPWNQYTTNEKGHGPI